MWLLDHPLDLNGVDEADLATIPGMAPDDARLVIRWRSRIGRFASVEQLARRGPEGLRIFQVLAPFTRVSATTSFHGRLRSRTVLRLPVASPAGADDAAGIATREYHRLMLRWGDAVAGELSLLREPGQPYARAYVTGGVAFSWPGMFIERVVVGDLSAGCAQGLVLGRAGGGLSDGLRGWGWSGPLRLESFHGTSGTRVIRGVGATMRVRSTAGVLSFGGCAGRTPFSATFDGEGNVRSLALRQDADQTSSATAPGVQEWSACARVAWVPQAGPACGVTFLWDRLSRPFTAEPLFGDVQEARILGLDLSMIAGRVTLAGEGAWMREGHALTGRVGLALGLQTELSVGAWFASPGFQNRKGGTGLTGSDLVNDAGVALRCECAPWPGMTCIGSVIRHGRPWRTALDRLPPEGDELSLRISQRVSRFLTLAVSLRTSTSESWERQAASGLLPRGGSFLSARRSYLITLDHAVSRSVRVQTRVAHVRASGNEPGRGSEAGWMMGSDVHVVLMPGITIDVRWELFATDSYASRVYLVERDVDGAYSSPPLSGSGLRWYALIRTSVVDGLALSARFAATQRNVRLHIRHDAPVLTLQCDADPTSLLPFR